MRRRPGHRPPSGPPRYGWREIMAIGEQQFRGDLAKGVPRDAPILIDDMTATDQAKLLGVWVLLRKGTPFRITRQ